MDEQSAFFEHAWPMSRFRTAALDVPIPTDAAAAAPPINVVNARRRDSPAPNRRVKRSNWRESMAISLMVARIVWKTLTQA